MAESISTIPTQGAKKGLAYKHLLKRHPDFKPSLWKRIRALYDGAEIKELLRSDPSLARDLFPKHPNEDKDIYQARIDRAVLFPYLGAIVDFITANLTTAPVQLKSDPEAHDKFYDDFIEDVSKPGSPKKDLNQFIRRQIKDALCFKRAWTLVDLPKPGEMDPDDYDSIASLGDQEEAGLLRAYACAIDPENVVDWELDENQELEWALLYYCHRERKSLTADRGTKREEWIYYTENDWQRYELVWTPGEDDPNDETIVPLVDEGPHSFGRVPLIPLELPPGLWAGGKIEAAATDHFNKRSALNWAIYKGLFQFLKITMTEVDPLNPKTEDLSRATSQVLGPGRAWVGAAGDDVSYVAPEEGPFRVAMEDLKDLRDEMHRVLHHMAMSTDNSAAATGRSGASKQVDQAQTACILRALGVEGREHVEDIFDMVQAGRAEPESREWKATGMDDFEEISMDDIMIEATALENITIPSPTFQKKYKLRLAMRSLPDLTDEEIEDIESELDTNITPEMFVPVPAPIDPNAPPGAPVGPSAPPKQEKVG